MSQPLGRRPYAKRHIGHWWPGPQQRWLPWCMPMAQMLIDRCYAVLFSEITAAFRKRTCEHWTDCLFGWYVVYVVYSAEFFSKIGIQGRVKSYYFPALVAAVPAQHPLFRVQNGTKVPWWTITTFDGLGLRDAFQQGFMITLQLLCAGSWQLICSTLLAMNATIISLCNKLNIWLVEYTRMQASSASLATSPFWTLTVAGPPLRDIQTQHQMVYDWSSNTEEFISWRINLPTPNSRPYFPCLWKLLVPLNSRRNITPLLNSHGDVIGGPRLSSLTGVAPLPNCFFMAFKYGWSLLYLILSGGPSSKKRTRRSMSYRKIRERFFSAVLPC